LLGRTKPSIIRALSGRVCGRATASDVHYTESICGFLLEEVLVTAGAAGLHGVRWLPGRSPIRGIACEVDVRGRRRELVV
jgi:hypothetical protein